MNGASDAYFVRLCALRQAGLRSKVSFERKSCIYVRYVFKFRLDLSNKNMMRKGGQNWAKFLIYIFRLKNIVIFAVVSTICLIFIFFTAAEALIRCMPRGFVGTALPGRCRQLYLGKSNRQKL